MFGDLVSPMRTLVSVRFRTRARMRNRRQILAEASRWLDGYPMLENTLNDRSRSASKQRGRGAETLGLHRQEMGGGPGSVPRWIRRRRRGRCGRQVS